MITRRAKLDHQLGYLVIRTEEIVKIHLSEISTLLIESTAVSLTTSLLAELMLSRLVDTFFSRTSWTMLLYAENHSISVA